MNCKEIGLGKCYRLVSGIEIKVTEKVSTMYGDLFIGETSSNLLILLKDMFLIGIEEISEPEFNVNKDIFNTLKSLSGKQLPWDLKLISTAKELLSVLISDDIELDGDSDPSDIDQDDEPICLETLLENDHIKEVITDTIPDYLRKILEAITGKPDTKYDENSDCFTPENLTRPIYTPKQRIINDIIYRNNQEYSELLLKNREYLEELHHISNQFAVHPSIIENLAIYGDQPNFMNTIKKKFPEMSLDSDNVLSGIYEGRHQFLILDKIFEKGITTLRNMIRVIFEKSKLSNTIFNTGLENQLPFQQSTLFEIGKYYRHTTGEELAIIGMLNTTMYGENSLIAESNYGNFIIVGKGNGGYTDNYVEITKDEWMKNFQIKEKVSTEYTDRFLIKQDMLNCTLSAMGLEIQSPIQQLMEFELGKYYRHTNGEELAIIAPLNTTIMCGEKYFLAESSCGDLVLVDKFSPEYTKNYIEITKDEWLESCQSTVKIPDIESIESQLNKTYHVIGNSLGSILGQKCDSGLTGDI